MLRLTCLASVALSLCVSSYASKADDEVESDAKTVKVTFPEIGEIITAQRGDVIAEAYDAKTVEIPTVAILSERVNRRTKNGWLRVPAGTPLFPSKDGWYCTTAQNRGSALIVSGQVAICLKDRDDDRVFDIVSSIYGRRSNTNVTAPYKFSQRFQSLAPANSDRRALFFGGYEAGRVSLTYIEFDNDPSEPTERMDGSVAYDPETKRFRFGNAVFEVRKLSAKKISIVRTGGHF